MSNKIIAADAANEAETPCFRDRVRLKDILGFDPGAEDNPYVSKGEERENYHTTDAGCAGNGVGNIRVPEHLADGRMKFTVRKCARPF